jgi:site-specific DNA-methyltransferase (adenine-specific)
MNKVSGAQEKRIETADSADAKIDFASVFKDSRLGQAFDELENKFNVVDETSVFESLVNTSISRTQPYHRWARYREAYAGELVREIITRLDVSPDSDYILDPMCGSGSTNVACKELGFDSLGMDVNGYSVLLSNTKLHNYTNIEKEQISELIKSYEVNQKSDLERFKDVERFFDDYKLDDLRQIFHWIRSVESKNVRHFLEVAWLAILEDCSNRKKDGNGLATRASKVEDVHECFKHQVKMMLSDVTNIPLPNKVTGNVVESSALNIGGTLTAQKMKKDLGAIIFSPPYANSFDYFESYKIELILGGYFKFSELTEARKVLIRNYRLGNAEKITHKFDLVEGLCESIWNAIPEKESKTGVRDGRTRLVPNMLRCYFDDMHKVLKSGHNSLRSKGTMSIVVDQSAYLGIPIPTDLILAFIGEQLGYRVTRLVKCRRANTSGQQLRSFPYLKNMLRESIVTMERNDKST